MDVISMMLTADPASLSVVRERVRRWLGTLRWPAEEIEDIVMAVNEAVSNAVEHSLTTATTAEVRVAGRPFVEADGGRRIMIGVAGDGRWRPEPAQSGLRAYGLLTIYTCMDAVETSCDADGTTLMMTSAKVSPL